MDHEVNFTRNKVPTEKRREDAHLWHLPQRVLQVDVPRSLLEDVLLSAQPGAHHLRLESSEIGSTGPDPQSRQ